ncbi:hypothetical protein ANO14919_097320 [Xylariales sp. No.14919]|nr:hypothetical protein ANO14919_097320 [Xylariales sp. No.14919]
MPPSPDDRMEAQRAFTPSQEAVNSVTSLSSAIQVSFPAAVDEFRSRWAAARAVCRSQSISTDDYYDACIQKEEFVALHKLGPKIIPFVVYKLASGDAGQDLWAVFLYNALEKDPKYRPNLQVDKDLRRCRKAVVELSYQRNRIAEERIEAWKQHHRRNQIQSDTYAFLGCEEYFDLLEMGPSIIAQLMVGYCDLKWGAWYELLHEINHGHQMGAHMVQKHVVFDVWCRWFNYGEHRQVPKYIPTELDRQILGSPARTA